MNRQVSFRVCEVGSKSDLGDNGEIKFGEGASVCDLVPLMGVGQDLTVCVTGGGLNHIPVAFFLLLFFEINTDLLAEFGLRSGLRSKQVLNM